MADELRLKVSSQEYIRQIGSLDSKMAELDAIIGEYQSLKSDAVRVLGDDDDNLNKMQANLDKNIRAVQGQRELLKQQRDMLQKQMDDLGLLTTHVDEMFQAGMDTARSLYKTIKVVGELTD